MYIAKLHAGCGNDLLWMTLIQNQIDEVCSYETNIPSSNIPKLYYAPGDTYSTEPGCEYIWYPLLFDRNYNSASVI